jgi:hypothetical protein
VGERVMRRTVKWGGEGRMEGKEETLICVNICR